jgi:hypothetical protein
MVSFPMESCAHASQIYAEAADTDRSGDESVKDQRLAARGVPKGDRDPTLSQSAKPSCAMSEIVEKRHMRGWLHPQRCVQISRMTAETRALKTYRICIDRAHKADNLT